MPQGTVIAIKPIGFADTSSSTEEQLRQTTSGEVEILDGKYAGQFASFDQEGEGSLSVGEKVKLKIIDKAEGKLQARLC